MPPIQHPELDAVSLQEVLHALSDPVRLQIVRYTLERPGSICGDVLSHVPKSSASHHWRVLRQAGVLRQVPQGTTRCNSVRREELDARFPGLLDAVLRAAEAEG